MNQPRNHSVSTQPAGIIANQRSAPLAGPQRFTA